MIGNPFRPHLAPSIRAKLNALRRRIRRYVWMQGLATGVAWLGVAFWVSFALDWFFEPPPVVRGLLLGIVGLGLLGILFRLIFRRAFVRLTDGNMAMLLERYFPQFQETLLTAVELTGRVPNPEECNPEMLARTCREAAQPIRQVHLRKVFNPVPLWSSGAAAMLLAATVSIFSAWAPSLAGIWARRSLLFSDELWPRTTRLVVDGFPDGVAKVARGADLEVVAKADLNMPKLPDAIELRYRTEGGGRHRQVMARDGTADPSKDEFQEFSHTFTGILAPIRLDVLGRSRPKWWRHMRLFGVLTLPTPDLVEIFQRDDAVRGLRIEVVDSPTIVEMVLDCRFPEYMDRQSRTDVPVTGVMQLPVGTRITVLATANKDLIKAEIADDDNSHVQMHEVLWSFYEIVEQQKRIREHTPSADPEWLAGYQGSLVGVTAALADYMKAAEADGVEAPGQGQTQDPASKRLEAAGQRMLESQEKLLAMELNEAPDKLLEALREKKQAAVQSKQDTRKLDQAIRAIEQAKARRDEVIRNQDDAVDELQRAGIGLEQIYSFRSFPYAVEHFTEDQILWFTLFDTDHVKGREPVRLTLAAVADEPPQLAVQLRGIGSAITSQARLPAAGRVTDDYGIAKIWFDHAVDGGTPGTDPILSPSGNPTEIPLDHALEVRDLALTPGQKITVSVKAADRYDLAGDPNVGSSERWLLDVVTPEQLRTMLESRELVLRQRFERIIEEVNETRDSLVRIDFGTPADDEETTENAEGAEPGDEPDEEEVSPERLLALRMLRVQRALQNSQKNAHETLGVAEAFADIREELINNRIDTEELKIRIEDGIATPLRRIAEEMFPELDRRLDDLQATLADPNAGPENRNRASRQVDAILLAMQQVLNRMLELEDFNKAVELLRAIIDAQEKLNEQTKQRHKQKLRELMEE